MTQYVIDITDGFIYKFNNRMVIDEIAGFQFYLNNEELLNYKEITKEQYYDIYYATKENTHSFEDEKFLSELIENVLTNLGKLND